VAKRLTDTSIWDKAWFRKLTPRMKEAWRYLCDRCDHAGVWDIDYDAITFNVGEPVSWADIEKSFGSRVKIIAHDKLLITGFIEFQYKTKIENLNPDNRVHFSVIQRLSSLGVCKPLTSPMQGCKDKDKDKDTVKEKEKEKDRDLEIREIQDSIPIITQELWAHKYPDPDWIIRQIADAYDFHTSNPAERPANAGQWMKKLTTWLSNNWAKRERERARTGFGPGISLASISLKDYSSEEGA